MKKFASALVIFTFLNPRPSYAVLAAHQTYLNPVRREKALDACGMLHGLQGLLTGL